MEFWKKQERPEKELFVTDRGEQITAADFETFQERLASCLISRKLGLILCKNVPGSVMGYLTFLRNGVVPLLLDAKMQRKMILSLLTQYDPDYIWCPRETLKEYLPEGICKFEGYRYSLIQRKTKTKHTLHPDLALLLSTSGSTGSGKLVRLSYQNLQKNAESIAKYLNLQEEERPITTLPMNYTYGLSVLHSHRLVGATVLLTERSVFEKEFWDFLKKEKATSISGVPYTYEMLKWMRFDRMDLPSLRTMTQAGGHLQSALQREFGEYALRTGRKFYIMYGQTEATARMTYLPPEKVCEKIGSIGIPIPGGSMELSEERELIYRGENVSMGYATCRADLEKGDERDGILYTGDLGRQDSEGYFYITGRKKRFLKICGKRIQLDEVENRLQERFGETGFACTGTDRELVIWMEECVQNSEEEIKNDLEDLLKINAQAFRVEKIREIPVNANGKRDYKQLEKWGENARMKS